MRAARLHEELSWHPKTAVQEQEAYLNLRRTHERLFGEFALFFKRHGLSESQFNILRILQGAPEHSMASLAIRERLISRVPDITRLLDGMERAGLVERARSGRDRRVVRVTLTHKGQSLLARLAEPLLELHRKQFEHLSATEVARLSRLLEKARVRDNHQDVKTTGKASR